ncbi:MAG: hypothetical protein R3F14_42280 [Polyangiaceae bacterium]
MWAERSRAGDYEFAAGTTGALVAVDRANRHTARDLSRAEARLGALAFDARDYGVAVPCYERAYHVLVRARSGMPALFRKEMDALRQEIDRMHKRIARSRSTSEDLRRVAADLARAAQEPG